MIIQLNYILLLVILLVIILSLTTKYKSIKELKVKQSEKTPKLIKCDRLNIHDNIQHTINKNNILRAKNGELDWDIYLPCGYNYVEDEIENIIIRNKDQKIFAIKGCDKIASKNYLWKILVEQYGVSKASTIMPRTYIISSSKNNTQCLLRALYLKAPTGEIFINALSYKILAFVNISFSGLERNHSFIF